MVEIKLFLQICSLNIMYPKEDNMIVTQITKRIGIITSIQVCLISRMNFDYEENGGKESFSCKSKASISYIQYGEHNCSANKKKNGDYFEYPSLSHFSDEL